MKNSQSKSRRSFLKKATAATSAALITSKTRLAAKPTDITPRTEAAPQVSPNDRIRLGLIGAGGMGFGDTETALKVPGIELVAVADIYDGRFTAAKERFGNHLFTTRDHRELLARRDIDAVIVATPDHWHSAISMDAMKAGKDVYCEKPMVQQLWEGADVIKTAKETGRIMQVGSQYSSGMTYLKAKELVEKGVIGKVNLVESSIVRRSSEGAWQYTIPTDASPATIDWDRFLGRAPKRSFEPIRLFRWRNYRDYGTGIGGDLFVHLFTGTHVITGAIGPSKVFSTGGIRLWNDGRDVPDQLLGLFDYEATDKHPAFTVNFKVNFADGSVNGSGPTVFRFVGDEGVIELQDGVRVIRLEQTRNPTYPNGSFPKAMLEEMRKEYNAKYPRQTGTLREVPPEMRFTTAPGYDPRLDHFRTFFAGMRSRKPVLQDPTFGFRCAAPALLCNLSYFEKRIAEWDPVNLVEKGKIARK
ncbi:MAG: Gfo/Idh/MocA family oxidoreductase [Blastocatellia bacterium]